MEVELEENYTCKYKFSFRLSMSMNLRNSFYEAGPAEIKEITDSIQTGLDQRVS